MVSSWKYEKRCFSYITEEQLLEVVGVLHDPDVEKYLWFAPITIDTFRAYALPIIHGQQEAWGKEEYPGSAIFTVRENETLLGVCGISEIPDGHNVSLIGYQLAPQAWGQGIGTCCAEFIIHYAKRYLQVRKLFGDCVAENKASVKILEKCGFVFEGAIKEKYEMNGVLHDNNWYGLRIKDATELPADAVQEIY